MNIIKRLYFLVFAIFFSTELKCSIIMLEE